MDESPLAKLPAELRVLIYQHVLRTKAGEYCVWSYTHHIHRSPYLTRRPLALTQVCRTIRQETSGMFFALNRLTLDGELVDYLANTFFRFVAAFGKENEQAIRQVTIRGSYRPSEWTCESRFRHACISCARTLDAFKRLHHWSAGQCKASLDVSVGFGAYSGYAPVDLRFLCAWEKVERPRVVDKYMEACAHGAAEGNWYAYEKLTGLHVRVVHFHQPIRQNTLVLAPATNEDDGVSSTQHEQGDVTRNEEDARHIELAYKTFNELCTLSSESGLLARTCG